MAELTLPPDAGTYDDPTELQAAILQRAGLTLDTASLDDRIRSAAMADTALGFTQDVYL